VATSNYSSALTVEELDADGSSLRILTLIGPGLPRMGAKWARDSTLSTKWYAGNPDEATQLVLVTKELPSEWEGEWNLTRLNRRPCRYVESQQGGAAVTVTAPGYLVDVFEDMQAKGRRLRVTWVTDSDDPQVARTLVREGRIKMFEAGYRTSVDIEWRIAFHWASRGQSQQRVAATRDSQSAGSTAAVQSTMQATQAAVQELITESNIPTTFTLGQLEQLANAPLALLGSLDESIEDGLFSFQQVAGIITQFRNLPPNLAAQILGTATDTLSACKVFIDSIEATPAEQAVQSDAVDDLTRTWQSLGDVIDSSVQTARQAQSVQAQMRLIASVVNSSGGRNNPQASSGTRPGNILAIRITRDGDTPQSISNLYYGTPDQDIAILQTNDLPWYQATFDVGTVLVIPVLGVQQQQQATT
jgi:hypothetical protein